LLAGAAQVLRKNANGRKMNGKNPWRSVYDTLYKIMKWSMLVTVLGTVIVLLLCVLDVIGSKFFNRGIPGSVALIAQMNLVMVFMAVAFAQIERGNIGIAFLNRYLPAGLNHAIAMAGHALGMLLCGFLSWRTLVLVQEMIAIGDINNSGGLEFPYWPFGMVNLYGYAMLTIAFILCFGRELVASLKK
jgi:TRAP-type C4-dicarboxylate transport system permease small subunit